MKSLRGAGRVADLPRSGRPRVTLQHQDRAFRLFSSRSRHLTTTKMPLLPLILIIAPFSPELWEIARGWYSGTPSVCQSGPDAGTSHASYDVVGGTCPRTFPWGSGDESFLLTSSVLQFLADVVGNALPTLVLTREIDLVLLSSGEAVKYKDEALLSALLQFLLCSNVK